MMLSHREESEKKTLNGMAYRRSEKMEISGIDEEKQARE